MKVIDDTDNTVHGAASVILRVRPGLKSLLGAHCQLGTVKSSVHCARPCQEYYTKKAATQKQSHVSQENTVLITASASTAAKVAALRRNH